MRLSIISKVKSLWTYGLSVLLVVVVVGCGSDNKKQTVTATTPIVGAIVADVLADPDATAVLMSATDDPHDYELRPSDINKLSGADILITSGAGIDAWIDGVGSKPDRQLDIASALKGRGSTPLSRDPHWWHSPKNIAFAADAIAKELAEVYPERADELKRNARHVGTEMQRLEVAVKKCVGPTFKRAKIVTRHTALEHYGAAFGLHVADTVLSSNSTTDQPSLADIMRLKTRIKRDRIDAIFAEQGHSNRLERSLAKGGRAKYGGELILDQLGPEGSPTASISGLILENSKRIMKALTGKNPECLVAS